MCFTTVFATFPRQIYAIFATFPSISSFIHIILLHCAREVDTKRLFRYTLFLKVDTHDIFTSSCFTKVDILQLFSGISFSKVDTPL